MEPNPFSGTWVYRSLFNVVDEPKKLEDLLLWQATLTLEPDGPNLVKGSLSAGNYSLNVRGATIRERESFALNLRATGIAGTPTAGWIYDYSGYLAHGWPTGDSQRPAIVGTVIRTVPHAPDRPADISYSFVAVNRDVPVAAYELPQAVVAHFADKMHRLHHAVWHGIREMWDELTPQVQKQLQKLDWQIEGNRLALTRPGQKTRPAIENGSGEDFLYFHRKMVGHYRMMMNDLGAQIVEWPEIPQPGSGADAGDTVPPAWKIQEAPNFERRLAALKTDEFFWSRMRWWEVKFKNPKYLATLSLGELGAILQYSIHNDMHIRWSATPRDPETNAVLPTGRPDSDISDRWDNPKYNWLGEFYSSHVNPVFWRLHGWIDDRIEDWVAAHEQEHPGSVERTTLGGVDWFEKGKWIDVDYPWVWPRSLGGLDPKYDHDPSMRNKRIASMKKVMAILFPPETVDAKASKRSKTGRPDVKRHRSMHG